MPEITLASLGAYTAAIVLLFVLGKALALPLRLIGKLLLNGVAGGVVLYLINLLGGSIGIDIGINPLTALIAGFLGLPGIITLVLLQYVFLL